MPVTRLPLEPDAISPSVQTGRTSTLAVDVYTGSRR